MDTFEHLLPVFVGLAAGQLLRQTGKAQQRDGEFVMRLVYFVCAPALTFLAFSTVEINRDLLAFPISAVIMMVSNYFAARYVARHAHVTEAEFPVFLMACTITNSGFALVFAQALYGGAGVARVAAFDAVGATLVFTWVYSIAARANPNHSGESVLVRSALKSPPLYGLIAGVLFNVANWTTPTWLISVVEPFGSATVFLITIGIGVLFSLHKTDYRAATFAIVTCIVVGMGTAVACILLFDLHGTSRAVMLLLGLAPVGFNSVTFSSLEQLDVEFAAGTLSLSIIVGTILLTAVSFILN